jgi:hypothetical protein
MYRSKLGSTTVYCVTRRGWKCTALGNFEIVFHLQIISLLLMYMQAFVNRAYISHRAKLWHWTSFSMARIYRQIQNNLIILPYFKIVLTFSLISIIYKRVLYYLYIIFLFSCISNIGIPSMLFREYVVACYLVTRQIIREFWICSPNLLDFNSYNYSYPLYKFTSHKPEACLLVRFHFTSYLSCLLVSLLSVSPFSS